MSHPSVEIRRDLDPALLQPLSEEVASTEDGMLLNHSYCDTRGCDLSDLREVLAAEGEWLDRAFALEPDSAEMDELMDEMLECDVCGFDLGVNAAVVAISAAGATPISSCNGGQLGGHHASAVPYVLFSMEPEQLPHILASAEAADCGLENNGGHAELYAADLRNLCRFARELQSRLGPAQA